MPTAMRFSNDAPELLIMTANRALSTPLMDAQPDTEQFFPPQIKIDLATRHAALFKYDMDHNHVFIGSALDKLRPVSWLEVKASGTGSLVVVPSHPRRAWKDPSGKVVIHPSPAKCPWVQGKLAALCKSRRLLADLYSREITLSDFAFING